MPAVLAAWLVGIAVLPASLPSEEVPGALAANSYVERISGSNVQFEMIAIPEGQFWMGSPKEEPGRSQDEGPRHLVAIRPFWMGKTEVTWEEFDQFMHGKKSPTRWWQGEDEADAITRPTESHIDYANGNWNGYPAVGMTHHSAMEYCRWLSLKTGRTYRLPTEAEWEYACRAGTTTAYFFGNDPALLEQYGWLRSNSKDAIHKVGTRKPNPWGLHDMYGNVKEWCLDHYQKDFYGTGPADKPAISPVSTPCGGRFGHVARGGAFFDRPKLARSAAREFSDKTWMIQDPGLPRSIWWLAFDGAEGVGFRVVRPESEQDNLRGLRSQVKSN